MPVMHSNLDSFKRGNTRNHARLAYFKQYSVRHPVGGRTRTMLFYCYSFFINPARKEQETHLINLVWMRFMQLFKVKLINFILNHNINHSRP